MLSSLKTIDLSIIESESYVKTMTWISRKPTFIKTTNAQTYDSKPTKFHSFIQLKDINSKLLALMI
jgi:hypothetical protein